MNVKGLLGKYFRNRKKTEIRVTVGDDFKRTYVSEIVEDNKEYLKEILKYCADIIYRDVFVGSSSRHVLLVYVDGMVDKKIINQQVLRPIMTIKDNTDIITSAYLMNKIISSSEVGTSNTFDDLGLALLSGDAILFVEGSDQALIIGSRDWAGREVNEPTTEQTTRGPKEGFVETLKQNLVLVRRRIKDPNLAVEIIKVGRRTKTDVAILYLKGVVREGLPTKVRHLIESIDTDSIIGSAELEQLIERRKWTVFPQVLATERPDKAAASILEGRVVIIVDGTPFILIAPITFAMFLNSSEDYYERTFVSTGLRVMRYFSYFLSSSLPAVYLALTAFHPGMLPTPLVLSIIGSRIGLPLPVLIEVLFMEFTIEILTEASIRLPRGIGQSISIVGGLVIGQAAVQAGMVSPIIVIVIALTAMTSFVIPVYTFTLSNRMLRIPLIIAAAILGLYGVVIGWLVILIHLASIECFGVRYLEDFSPFHVDGLKDTIFKASKSMMNKRPRALNPEDVVRQNYKPRKS